MHRRQVLRTAVGVVAAGTVAGCSSANRTQDASGTLAVNVGVGSERDALEALQELSVTFDAVRVNEGAEFVAHDIEPTTVDFAAPDGDSQTIGELELESKTYGLLQLVVGGSNVVLNDGTEASIETQPGDPITYEHGFDVFDGMTTTFSANTAPVADESGESPTYQLLPDPDE